MTAIDIGGLRGGDEERGMLGVISVVYLDDVVYRWVGWR